jgi:CO/xanthine dehydrogenase FAD-binding subunit
MPAPAPHTSSACIRRPGTETVATRAARAEDCLTGSRLTPDLIDAAADAANDGITFTGDAFGSAAYLAELLPIYVSRALRQIVHPAKSD